MPWEAINPSLLSQDDASATMYWYRDDDPLRPGDLAVWLDGSGELVRFQLAYTPSLGGGELFTSWEKGVALRMGEIESAHRSTGYARSSVVRRRALSATELATLCDYVATNTKLPTGPREAVIGVLSAPMV